LRSAIARCTSAGCANLGRLILRYADAGGRPMTIAEVLPCARPRQDEGARAAGLKVYDDRYSGSIQSPTQVARYLRRSARNSRMAALTSAGFSCCAQWPEPLMLTCLRLGTQRSIPLVCSGHSTGSSSAVIIREG
jgi:hypothetical protein